MANGGADLPKTLQVAGTSMYGLYVDCVTTLHIRGHKDGLRQRRWPTAVRGEKKCTLCAVCLF